MKLENFKNKKIAIVGMGVNNQKLAKYFTLHDIDFVEIKDWKKNSDLIGQLVNYDMVFRTPGLPYLSQAIQQAIVAGVEVTSQTNFFFELCPVSIIGVTGTKGKGTTATLISQILEKADRKVWLAGNIGTDPFEFLDLIQKDDLVVLELSSFQLQDLHQSPHVAVVLNITADHLDESGTYEKSAHANLKEYFDAKMQMIKYQTADDFAILSHELSKSAQSIGDGQKIIFHPQAVADYQYQLLGKHNLENIAAAAAACKIFGVSENIIRQAVRDFHGLPHRLQKVLEKDGITYIDDSISTNEDSTVAALAAFSSPLILILGGASKGLNYSKLGSAIRQSTNLKGVVVVGEEAPKILEAIIGFDGIILTGAQSMREMVAQAKSIAQAGDTILLSPAAASFGMFIDYKDRADQFLMEIR